jgi:Membrane domain of glycerophosphoryl diester phosphodiesterase
MADAGQRMTFTSSAVRSPSSGFRFGAIFTNAWSIYAANFLTFTGVAVVIGLPDLIEADPQTRAGAALLTLAGIAGLILEFIGLAVILYGAFQAMRGRDIAIADVLQHTLSRVWAIVAVAFLLGIALLLGLMLFILPAIVMAVRWVVALPACIVEGLGPFDSFRRSAELTEGHRWKIFGLLVVALLLFIGARLLVGIPSEWIVNLVPESIARTVVDNVISSIVVAICTAYFNIVLVMIYRDLRIAKEGVDTEQIAAVFD